MPRIIAALILFVDMWLVLPGRGHANIMGGCPGDSGFAALVFEALLPEFTGDEPEDVEFRQVLGLARVSSSEAAIVTDSAGCAMLRERVDTYYSAVPSASHIVRLGYRVYRMRFGQQWVAYVRVNPEPGMAERHMHPVEVFRGDSLIHVASVLF